MEIDLAKMIEECNLDRICYTLLTMAVEIEANREEMRQLDQQLVALNKLIENMKGQPQ